MRRSDNIDEIDYNIILADMDMIFRKEYAVRVDEPDAR